MLLPLTPSVRLVGRRAFGPGGGGGDGAGAAAALAQAGAKVFPAARSLGEIEAVVDAIRDEGGDAQAIALDVTDVAAARQCLAALPPFDILVNNAGTNRPKPMIEVTIDDYDVVDSLNLKAAFFLAQAVVSQLVTAGRPGSIIHISSQMGHVGAANRTLYCATKHGLEGLTKAMAVELGPLGIRVNSIAPTFIETPMTRPFLEDEAFRSSVLAKIKLGRLGIVEDVMGAIVYLASDAAALVTGTSLRVDGGWTAE